MGSPAQTTLRQRTALAGLKRLLAEKEHFIFPVAKRFRTHKLDELSKLV